MSRSTSPAPSGTRGKSPSGLRIEGQDFLDQGIINKTLASTIAYILGNPVFDGKEAKKLRRSVAEWPIDELDRLGSTDQIEESIQFVRYPCVTHGDEDISPSAIKDFNNLFQERGPVNEENGLRTLLMAIVNVASSHGLTRSAILNLLRRHCGSKFQDMIRTAYQTRGGLKTLWRTLQESAMTCRPVDEAIAELHDLTHSSIKDSSRWAYGILKAVAEKSQDVGHSRLPLFSHQMAIELIMSYLRKNVHTLSTSEMGTLQSINRKAVSSSAQGDEEGMEVAWDRLIVFLQRHNAALVQATSTMPEKSAPHLSRPGNIRREQREENRRRNRPLHVVDVSDSDSVSGRDQVQPKTVNEDLMAKWCDRILEKTSEQKTAEERRMAGWFSKLSSSNDALVRAISEIKLGGPAATMNPATSRAKESRQPNDRVLSNEYMARSPRQRGSQRLPTTRNVGRAMEPRTDLPDPGFRYGGRQDVAGGSATAQGVSGGAWNDGWKQARPWRPLTCWLCGERHPYRMCRRFAGQIPQDQACPACAKKGLYLRHLPCKEVAVDVATINAPVRSSETQPLQRRRQVKISRRSTSHRPMAKSA